MNFSTSERVRTTKTPVEVLGLLEDQFRKVSRRVENDGNTVKAFMTAASFGSANRETT